MSNFEKVLTTLDAAETDINNEHKASEATKKRMETLDKRFTDEDKALKEANKLTQTAENVLKVEVVLNAANLSTLKTNLGDEWFKDFLRNIAHRNEDKRASALRQMETILSLPNPLSLSMSDKHSEQLIRTEILDHIAQQLLGWSNLTIAANYIYGTDQVLDDKLDDMSNQIIAMLEWFKESESKEPVNAYDASYNAMFKASDQRYFDDDFGGNKLRSKTWEVMKNFAKKMSTESLIADNWSSVISYKELANKLLSVGVDLNIQDLRILTGNGMLPFEARTRSQFKFQYLTYLPELGGYAGVMANGCGDEGKEGNFVFIKDDQSETSKKLTRDGFITEEERKLNEEKKKIEKTITITDEELIKKAEGKGEDLWKMTKERKEELKKELIEEKAKEALKLKEEAAKKVKEEEEKKFKDELITFWKTEEESNKIIEKAKAKGLDLWKITDQQKEDLIKEVKEEIAEENLNQILENEAEILAKEEAEKVAKAKEIAEKAKIIEDETWEGIDGKWTLYPEGTLNKEGSKTRGIVKFKSPDWVDLTGKTIYIQIENPSNPGQPWVSEKFTIGADGEVLLPDNVYLKPQTEPGMADIVVSNKPITDPLNPEGSKEVHLIDNTVPTTDNNVNKEGLQPSNRWQPILREKIQNLFKKAGTLPPYTIDILENDPGASPIQKSGFGITLKELEDYIVDQATPQDPKEITDWRKIDNAIRDVRHRLFVANKIRTLKYKFNGQNLVNKHGAVDTGPMFSPKEKAKELALDFLASSPTLEKWDKIVFSKSVVVNGVTFPKVTFESGGIWGQFRVNPETVQSLDWKTYNVRLTGLDKGTLSIQEAWATKEKEEVTE